MRIICILAIALMFSAAYVAIVIHDNCPGVRWAWEK